MAELETESSCDLPKIDNDGPIKWSMTRTKKGYRNYSITHRVKIDRTTHGPLAALNCPGLPEPGSEWDEGTYFDDWAFFTQEATVTQVGREANNLFFDVTQIATSDPTGECAEESKEDPLSIRDRVHIESVDFQREMVYDGFGDPIVNSAFEQYRGPQVEFDDNRIRVVIEQNAGALDLDLLESLLHHVNDYPLWGFPAYTIKFSKFDIDPKYYTNCAKFYLRRMTFDIDRNTWVRRLLDEGTKVLHGRWDQAKGEGLQVDVITDGDGHISDLVIESGNEGSGYPASTIVPIKIIQGDAVGGIGLFETNSSGVPTTFIRVHLEGTGYTDAPGLTQQRGYWVITRFKNGEIPDPSNPMHFDRPGDIKGQNTRCILDGKGLPIGAIEEAGEIQVDYYPAGNLLLLGIPLGLEEIL